MLDYNQYGALFENLIIANRYKASFHVGVQHPVYFYRDNHQVEVDLVEEWGQRLQLTEIKASTTYRLRMANNLQKIAKAAAEQVDTRLEVVYGGEESLEIDGVRYSPWVEG